MSTTHSIAKCLVAAVYLRRSTEQQEESIARQRSEVEAFLHAHPQYRVSKSRWFTDDDSGWKEDRTAFREMIEAAQRREFSVIIVVSQDRFSRFDPVDFNYYLKILRDSGVTIVTVDSGPIDYSDLGAWLAANVNQHAKNAYVKDLAGHVQSGQHKQAQQGKWLCGDPPLGYLVGPDRKLMIDLGTAHQVQELFELYVAGNSLTATAIELNARGYRTRRGNLWSRDAVRDVIRNDTYLGHYRWGERQKAKFAKRSSDIVVFIANNHPAIVDPRTFQAANRKRESRGQRTTPHQNGGNFVLTGLLKCGECGSSFAGNMKRDKVQYYCSRGGRRRGCGGRRTVQQDEVLEHIISAIEQYYGNEKTIAKLKKKLISELTGGSRVNPKTLEGKLKSVESKISKTKRRLLQVDDDFIGIVQDELRLLTAQQTELQEALAAAETPQAVIDSQVTELVNASLDALKELRTCYEAADPVLLRELLSESIEEVRLWVKKRDDLTHQGRWVIDRGEIECKNLSGRPHPVGAA